MKQRIIASAVVFVVGFGIGLGVTYALLAKKPAEAPEMADGDYADPSGDPAEATSPMAAAARPAPDQAPQAADEAPAPTDEAPAQEAAPADEEPAPADEEPAPADEPEEAPAAAEEEAPVPADEPEEAPAPADEPEAAPADGPWWKGLQGKKARVDLGRARALTIRKGELKDGDVLDWSQFGRNPRIGVLFQEDQNIVTVHGVAVNAAGTPVAAQITLDKQGRETTGVIALHTQGLNVTLHAVDGNPVDGEMATP